MRKTFAVFALVFCFALSTRGQGATQNVITNIAPAAASGGPWVADTTVSKSATPSGGSSNFAATTTAGDTIVVGIGSYSITTGQAVTSVTVTGGACGSPFSKIIAQTFTGGYDAEIWAGSNCPASVSMTVNFSGGGTVSWQAVALKGMPSTVITDGTNTSSGASSGTSIAGPSVTPTKTGDFIYTVFDPLHSVTAASAGWTFVGGGSLAVGFAYLTSNSAASGTGYATTWTISLSGGYSAVTAAFATH